MKKFKKILVLLTMVAATFSLSCSSVYAGELRKGTCRVVMYGSEIANDAGELVYNGHRYLYADVYPMLLAIKAQSQGVNLELAKSETNTYKGYVTYYFTPSGYITLRAGSSVARLGGYDGSHDYNLVCPAAMYNGKMYISMEDIAHIMGCNYGFDASKNTMYFY